MIYMILHGKSFLQNSLRTKKKKKKKLAFIAKTTNDNERCLYLYLQIEHDLHDFMRKFELSEDRKLGTHYIAKTAKDTEIYIYMYFCHISRACFTQFFYERILVNLTL